MSLTSWREPLHIKETGYSLGTFCSGRKTDSRSLPEKSVNHLQESETLASYLPSVLLKVLSKTIEDKNTLQIISFYDPILIGNQAIKNRVPLKLQNKITKQNKSKSKNKTKTKNHPQAEVKTCWTNHCLCLNKYRVTLSARRAVQLLFIWTGLTCSESRFQSFALLFYF